VLGGVGRLSGAIWAALVIGLANTLLELGTTATVGKVLVPALIAAILGYFVFRSRVQGVYFSIITQALTLLTSIWFVGQQAYTGGANGITNVGSAQIFGMSVLSPTMQRGFYFATVICLVLVYLIARMVTGSRFGRLLVALRDNEDRVRFLGYNPVLMKVMIFALSASFAALAGILFVPQVGIISPSSMGVAPSIEMVIWVAVGGRGTLLGAIIGALVVSYGRSFFSETYPDIWQYFYGLLFVGSVLLFPKGTVGSLSDLAGWLRGRLMRAQQEEPRTTKPYYSERPLSSIATSSIATNIEERVQS